MKKNIKTLCCLRKTICLNTHNFVARWCMSMMGFERFNSEPTAMMMILNLFCRLKSFCFTGWVHSPSQKVSVCMCMSLCTLFYSRIYTFQMAYFSYTYTQSNNCTTHNHCSKQRQIRNILYTLLTTTFLSLHIPSEN